ncbi:biotin/lipoyl-containing protein [Flavobacterium lacus]|uniref:Biotin carboxyl carrier protein n=1 Tax=Flavobacterium lacus TaxID=1353778 RepID=A0A328WU05_9FLAO|nr:biotin/lipoyl-containing protein [Flavobacterium lacus]RAR47334.1 biotin carboxyl carrier protein [Flavobacterium lacus]
MKKFNFKINGNRYEVVIDNLEEDVAHVQVNGTAYTVELEKKSSVTKTPKIVRSVAVPSTDSSETIAKTSHPAAPKGGGTIKSPLPGVILKLHVKVGDTVSISQELLTLEAMKMENSIPADKTGVVEAIHFTPGDAVMEGDILMTIK